MCYYNNISSDGLKQYRFQKLQALQMYLDQHKQQKCVVNNNCGDFYCIIKNDFKQDKLLK